MAKDHVKIYTGARGFSHLFVMGLPFLLGCLNYVRPQTRKAKKAWRYKLKTLFAIVMLIIFGAVASFASLFILNIAGLPGALIAGTPGKRSKGQFIFGSIISALGQSYVYLAFTAFIVNWTMFASRREDIIGFLLWPFAFFVVLIPIWITLIRARVEAREQENANPQVEALHLTLVITLLAFFIFAFVPRFMKAAWGWLPYLK